MSFCLINKMYFKLSTACLLVLFACNQHVTSKDYFPVNPGICPRSPIIGELDTNRFFSGRWYVQKSMGQYLFQEAGTCSTTVANITDDGTEIKLLHYQYQPLLDTYVKVWGTAKTKFTKYMGLCTPVQYNILEASHTQFEVPFAVLGTDYDNWAIIYMCKQYPTGYKSEVGWMMSRKRDDRSNIETMENVQRLIDNNRFIDEENTNCGPNEPDL